MKKVIDLGKLRFQFRDEYDPATAYEFNDVVRYGGDLYVYIYPLRQSGHLPTNAARWSKLLEGLRFRGTYDAAASYLVNEVVTQGANIYVAVAPSTGAAPSDASKWTSFAFGMVARGAYSGAAAYVKGDVVTYGASSYVARGDTAGNLPTDAAHWNPLASGVAFSGTYDDATAYHKGDIVTYGASSYVARGDTTGDLPTDPAKWELLAPGVTFRDTYDAATTYVKGDIVRYGASSYIARSDTTGNLPTDTSKWELLAGGAVFRDGYAAATAYHKGDIVTYGGNVYLAKGDTTGNSPADSAYWSPLAQGLKFVGTYAVATAYKPGEIVRFGNVLYLCIADAAGGAGNYPDIRPALFAALTSAQPSLKGDWATGTGYAVGDVVLRGASAYICVTPHTATTWPADSAKWSLFASGVRWRGTWAAATAYLKDDLVTDGISAFIAVQDFTSGATIAADGAKWAMFSKGQDVLPPQQGKETYVLSTDGTNPVWIDIKEKTFLVSANTAAVVRAAYLCDTTSAAFTLTLPASPVAGDFVRVIDAAGRFASNNLTINNNGKPIQGRLDTLIVDISNENFTLIFVNDSFGWRVM